MAEYQRFCSRCGKPVSPSDEYCPNCGFHLDDVRAQATNYQPYDAANAQAKQEEGKAKDGGLAALIAGIVSIAMPSIGIIAGIVAIIFGSKYKAVNKNAKIGFALGIVGIIWSILVIAAIITISVLIALGIIGAAGQMGPSYIRRNFIYG